MPNYKIPELDLDLKMKISKMLMVVAAFAGLTAVAAHAAPVNLVTNGGFETLTNGVGQIDALTKATGWTSTGYNFVFGGSTSDKTGANGTYGNVKLWGPQDGSANGLGASPVGGNFLAADGAYETQPITQIINGLVVGQQYNLSFWWAGAQQAGYNGSQTEQWIVSLGNQTISTAVYQNTSHGFSGWMQENFTYTATSTTEVLSFLAHGTPTGVPPFSLLDGVSLTAAVPEPSTSALFLAGFGLLAVAARLRRRNKSH
jgi:hypothetical protein